LFDFAFFRGFAVAAFFGRSAGAFVATGCGGDACWFTLDADSRIAARSAAVAHLLALIPFSSAYASAACSYVTISFDRRSAMWL
jgi:hypothetical protein